MHAAPSTLEKRVEWALERVERALSSLVFLSRIIGSNLLSALMPFALGLENSWKKAARFEDPQLRRS